MKLSPQAAYVSILRVRELLFQFNLRLHFFRDSDKQPDQASWPYSESSHHWPWSKSELRGLSKEALPPWAIEVQQQVKNAWQVVHLVDRRPAEPHVTEPSAKSEFLVYRSRGGHWATVVHQMLFVAETIVRRLGELRRAQLTERKTRRYKFEDLLSQLRPSVHDVRMEIGDLLVEFMAQSVQAALDRELMSIQRQFQCARPQKKLGPREEAVLAILREASPNGLSGKKITAILRQQGIQTKETTLRRYTFPALAQSAGVKNDRARGGYYL